MIFNNYSPKAKQILVIIKNWIIGSCNSRVLMGLAIMVYEPLYHALQIWQANAWFLGRFYSSFSPFSYILGALLIKQLFHSHLLDMRLVIANSYPTRAHGIIVNNRTDLQNTLDSFSWSHNSCCTNPSKKAWCQDLKIPEI